MPRLSGRSYDLSSVQAIHSKPTSRIGGVGIFVILCATVFLAPPSVASPYAYFILATCLLFVVGLLEDTGTPVSPRMRLLACVATSAIVIAMFNTWLPRLGVPGFDPLMSHALVGIPVTLFVTAGVANGFNLIDGVNGLAAFTAMVSAICLAMIAYQAGISEMVILALMLAAAISGFFVLNFPFGAIFLGDAGAYTIGFILSWFGIAILLAAPAASAWAILLTMFWPLADTLLAIFRRARRKADAMAPDRLHVHQMVMRVLEIHLLGRGKRHLANPLSTVVLAPFITAPALMGVAFWDHNSAAFAAVILSLAMFFGGYFAAFPVLRKMPRKRARNSDVPEEQKALQES
jgi:UDP-N-acetylmuramyl pentapeptide phosphotransferase/UDP-N-acetylglucosamine-1-phosphate transferase